MKNLFKNGFSVEGLVCRKTNRSDLVNYCGTLKTGGYGTNNSNRGVGCQQFVNGLYQAIGENKHHWFVS